MRSLLGLNRQITFGRIRFLKVILSVFREIFQMKRFAFLAVAALTLGACVPSEEVVLTTGGVGMGTTGTVITTGATQGSTIMTGTTVVGSTLSTCTTIAYSKTGEYCAD